MTKHSQNLLLFNLNLIYVSKLDLKDSLIPPSKELIIYSKAPIYLSINPIQFIQPVMKVMKLHHLKFS